MVMFTILLMVMITIMAVVAIVVFIMTGCSVSWQDG
jgi:hypothetical protein